MVNKIINWIQKKRDEGAKYINILDIINFYPKDLQAVLSNAFYHLNEIDDCLSTELNKEIQKCIPFSIYLKIESSVSSIATEYKEITRKCLFNSISVEGDIEQACLVLHSLIEQCFILKTKPFFNVSAKLFIKENVEEEIRIDFMADEVILSSYEGNFSDARFVSFQQKLLGKKIRAAADIKGLKRKILWGEGGFIEAFRHKINEFVFKNFEKIFFINDENAVESFPIKHFDLNTFTEYDKDCFLKYSFLHYGNFSFETHRTFLISISVVLGSKAMMNHGVSKDFLEKYTKV